MAQGNYSESQFLRESTSPPDGGIWLWVDQTRGQVKWVKLSHVTHDGNEVENLVQQLKTFSLDLNTPRDINRAVLPRPRQDWTISSQTHYRNLGYTLFRIDFPLSSNAVDSADGGSFSGAGFSFMATGNAIWHASGSGTELNPVLATGITASVPQGYFPKTTTYPREQFFRAYGNTQWFLSDGNATSNTGTITDPNSSFTNGRTEINSTPNTTITTRAADNVLPFYMQGSVNFTPQSTFTSEISISPTPAPVELTHDIAQINFAVHPSGQNRFTSVSALCGAPDSAFSGFLGRGIVLDVVGSNVLALIGGKRRIKAQLPNTQLPTAEISRVNGVNNRQWASDSLVTNGLGRGPNGQVGNFLINNHASYGGGSSIAPNTKAVATLSQPSPGAPIQLTQVTYCSNTPPPLRFSYTRSVNTVIPTTSLTFSRHRDNQPELSGQPVATAWAAGTCQRFRDGAPVAYWIYSSSRISIINELVNAEACTPGRNFVNSRIWYQSAGRADIILADGQRISINTNTGFYYPASGNMLGISGASTTGGNGSRNNGDLGNDTTGGFLEIIKYY